MSGCMHGLQHGKRYTNFIYAKNGNNEIERGNIRSSKMSHAIVAL